MKQFLTATALAIGLLATGSAASASDPGQMRVRDGGGVFTADGIAKAEAAFRGTQFQAPTELSVVTYPDIPEHRRAEFNALPKGDGAARDRLFAEWARETAKGDHDRGVAIFIWMGDGHHVEVLSDRETDTKRGFDDAKCKKTRSILVQSFQGLKGKPDAEARAARDAGLLKATEYVSGELKNTTVAGGGSHAQPGGRPARQASPLMGYICMGLVGLLGAWLVIGLIRAFTGGGGGGGGFGGGGYGGGGGGFMTSLLGGMFGAAAGMYLYDQFAGHGSSDLSAGQGYDGGNYDTGAGDFDGGGQSGGDFGDSGGGDFGGGDFGGGGGDFGGGDF